MTNQVNWRKYKLGDFLTPELRKVEKPAQKYSRLGIRSHGKGTFVADVDDPEDVGMDFLYEVRKDDLIVNITFAWEGAIAIVKATDEGCLVSHRFPTYVFNREIATPEYFRYVILDKKFVYQLGVISPGGAGRNRVMSKKDFLKIEVELPSLPEQSKIADILQTCDMEIDLVNQELFTLQQQKKGLMQKLLTGEVRVKV